MLLTAVGVLVANLVADLLYGVLDPRAQEGRGMSRRQGLRCTDGAAGDFMAEGDPTQAARPVEQVGDAETPEAWCQVIWSSKKARVGIIIVAVYVLVAIFAPLIAPVRPARRLLRAAGEPPSRALAGHQRRAARTSSPS